MSTVRRTSGEIQAQVVTGVCLGLLCLGQGFVLKIYFAKASRVDLTRYLDPIVFGLGALLAFGLAYAFARNFNVPEWAKFMPVVAVLVGLAIAGT